MNETTTVDLQKFLGAVEYPATKQDLVKAAKDHKAPQEVMSLLNGFTDKSYESITDVTEESHVRMM